jgi:hypothetical protein
MVLELELLFFEILNFSIFPKSYLQEVRNYFYLDFPDSYFLYFLLHIIQIPNFFCCILFKI